MHISPSWCVSVAEHPPMHQDVPVLFLVRTLAWVSGCGARPPAWGVQEAANLMLIFLSHVSIALPFSLKSIKKYF